MSKKPRVEISYLVRLHANNRILVEDCKKRLLERETRGAGALASVAPPSPLSDGLVVSHALWYLNSKLADGSYR